MSHLSFKSTIEPAKLKLIFELAETTSSGLSPKEYSLFWSKKLVSFILSGRYGRGFYLEDKSGDIVAGLVVSHHRAMYKEPPKGISAIPDPTAFGVNSILGLRVSHLYVKEGANEKEIVERLLGKAISAVEEELLKRELSKSSDKNDSFKQMVTDTSGKVDSTLANYYLSKKYFWFTHSSTVKELEPFGFKSSPLEGYRIPEPYLKSETVSLVLKLLELDSKLGTGKSLKLLDVKNNNDKDLIRVIMQEIELETVSQLNKSTYHSELSGGIRSSLSLTNVDTAISAAKLGSFNELTAISEQMAATSIGLSKQGSDDSVRRRSSTAFLVGVPRFSLLPDFSYLENGYEYEQLVAEKTASLGKDVASIQGAILTNELQRKSFYILWKILPGNTFQIIGMGELKTDGGFGSFGNDGSRGGDPFTRRRGSSFTGINEMGGFNFQDLDILISTAIYIANKKLVDAPVFVLLNDLPMSIPTPLLHDFFQTYMVKRLNGENEETTKESEIEYVPDFALYKLIPMLRKFGSLSISFEIDWIRNSVMQY
ncbi:hypothetical protein PUMCH_002991 [Australozyma saopauloensis]|uniref:Uncharacterized protein n=1 Tax=Australozyma saopauloensis TaxID=291208 RepID=A0AAX4HB90_9ASCO|nr:hypothetical protein PUMCH_002991 [[Candida] saopauloensis]